MTETLPSSPPPLSGTATDPPCDVPSAILIDSAKVNPYRLVYEITKFARRHKTPLHRSAFTYWEEELPTGLDLGKDKYGGPFTTEQVEDVKAFYGILKFKNSLCFGASIFLELCFGPYTLLVHK